MAFDPSSDVSANFGYQDDFQTTLSSSITSSDTAIPLTSLPTPTEGTLVIEPDGANEEEIFFNSQGVGVVNAPSASAGRGVNGTAVAHNSGVTVKMLPTKAGMDAIKYAGAITNSSIVARHLGTLLPTGMINGKLSVTVSSNNITVAVKTLAGSDPSSTSPVKVVLGGALRSITGALSVTKNAGTNWFGSGGTAFAAQEIDYFAYLGYNATDGVVIGFARFPYAKRYSDFSTTTTNEKYCAISTITNAASTDEYRVVGRFGATLSASASFNWSVPTYSPSNLVQYPIYETRDLAMVLGFTTAGTAPTYTTTSSVVYKIRDNRLHLHADLDNAAGGTAGSGANDLYFNLPFTGNSDWFKQTNRGRIGNGYSRENGGTIGNVTVVFRTSSTAAFITQAGANLTCNDQSDADRQLSFDAEYGI